MSNLRQQLSEFLMHEETPVESILGGYILAEVFHEIDSILRTAHPEAILNTLCFVRDAHRYLHPFRDDFREHLASSGIWGTLRDLLRAPNFGVRSGAIYTLGKLTVRERAHLLSDAFPFYLEFDPINLPGLLQEYLWLTNEWNWSLVEQVAAAEHYLKRWSLCEVLDDSNHSTETSSRILGVLERLKSDSHSMVAAEAKFRFERVNVKLGPKLPKTEWRKEAKRISNLEPRITFGFVAIRFMRDRADYSLEDFDRFVTNLE